MALTEFLTQWRDPRKYQITILALLLIYGNLYLGFNIPLERILAISGLAVLVQWCCTRLWRLPVFDPKSAFISSLSLSLLLRCDQPVLYAVAIVVTISSKFLLRANNKHIFNPVNFALAVMMLLTDQAWVSPGQWGTAAFILFLSACLGGLYVYRNSRSDVTIAFFVVYAGILFARAFWLGDPMSIAFHQIQNGAFLLFTFFMISDPKTSPDTRPGRILFACLVALVTATIQFVLYLPSALIWALVVSAPFVPLIDRILSGQHYLWPEYQTQSRLKEKMYE